MPRELFSAVSVVCNSSRGKLAPTEVGWRKILQVLVPAAQMLIPMWNVLANPLVSRAFQRYIGDLEQGRVMRVRLLAGRLFHP